MAVDTSLRQQNEAALQNPAVRNFLNAIASAEATDTYNYATGFGNTQLPSLDDHPREKKAFRESTGKRNYTTAAGRYQITAPTWDAVAQKNGSTSFDPYEQDLGAVQLLRERGALDAILKGDLGAATRAAGKTWAALPTSTAPQAKRTNTEWARLLARNATTLPSGANGTPIQQALLALPTGNSAVAFEPQSSPLAELLTQRASVTTPKAVTQEEIAPTPPGWASQLTNAVAQAQVDQSPDQSEQDIDNWRDTLIKQNIAQEADFNRKDAVSQFLGEPPVKRYTLPASIERAILRALGTG